MYFSYISLLPFCHSATAQSLWSQLSNCLWNLEWYKLGVTLEFHCISGNVLLKGKCFSPFYPDLWNSRQGSLDEYRPVSLKWKFSFNTAHPHSTNPESVWAWLLERRINRYNRIMTTVCHCVSLSCAQTYIQ